MFNAVKVFIEMHKDLIAKEDWEKFYQSAYDIKLPNYQVEELIHILESSGIDTAVNVRNELLFNELVANLKIAKQNQSNKVSPQMADKYVVQFLRAHLTNLFGFKLEEAIEVMQYNQKILGINLTPTHKIGPGQHAIQNYMITFDN